MSTWELQESVGVEVPGEYFFSLLGLSTLMYLELIWFGIKADDFPWILRPRCLLLASLP